MLKHLLRRSHAVVALTAAGFTLISAPAHARVLDDFDDNSKTDWADFTFVPGFGLPSETGGQFVFDLPPAGQDIFTASQKVSENIELREGRTVELRVDVVEGSGEDAFAVLAFIPNTGGNNPGTLAGYAIAKDPTDVLITKGIQRYFVADDSPAAEIKQNNITLSLTLTVEGGSVQITGRVLDKENNDAVLWERTVVDTPGEDAMADGTDSPAEPFITTGYFTLYCYQQFNAGIGTYRVVYDNAQVEITDAVQEVVLDNFDDNNKTDWSDFTFVPGFGLPQETGGEFVFDLPPAGQDIFTASQKVSRNIELQEGQQVELRVDVVEGSGEDAFAVLAFIPNTGGNNPGTLAGYAIAKDPTDVLITKGIQRYFVADDSPAAEIKQNNITLSLTLAVQGGSVQITGRVLDKENNDAVLWERTVVDTPGEDAMADGTDSPAEPFITTGYFTLYCYQQFNAAISQYRVVYDNAVLVTSAAANSPPTISEIQPERFANFLPSDTVISFKAADEKPLPKEQLSIVLNGTALPADALTITDLQPDGSAVRVSAAGQLAPDTNYEALLRVVDADGATTEEVIYFDTFTASAKVVEVEDYNFDGGSYINDPAPFFEGGFSPNSYNLQVGIAEIDFHDTRTAPNGENTMYRSWDPVRMQHSRDILRQKYIDAGGPDNLVYDYDVIDIAADEWLQYTRSFTPGYYEVYLRQAVVNMATAESVLEKVTGNPSQPNASTQLLGTFFGEKTGFQYRNFPLTDGTGQNKIVLQLSGVQTFRLRQVTPDPSDGARYQNYLVFVPVPPPGKQRAAVTLLRPAPDTEVKTVEPVIEVEIQNRETSVQVDSIELYLNEVKVDATVESTIDGARVTYPISPLPPSGVTQSARVAYLDNEGEPIQASWQFKILYASLDPATARTGPGTERGFHIRFVQAPMGSNLDNSLIRAEDQLAPDSTIPKAVDVTDTDQVINYSQNGPGSADGAFPGDELPPGLDPLVNGDDDFALEATCWLELTAGVHRMGVISDDGFKVVGGTLVNDPAVPALAFRSGGTANQTFDFIVPRDGFYPFRFVWYERGGGAHVEWFSVNRETGERILINSSEPGAIRAWLDAENVPVDVLEYADQVQGPYVEDPAATLNAAAGQFTTTAGGQARFYRIRSTAVRRITDIQLSGGQVTIQFE